MMSKIESDIAAIRNQLTGMVDWIKDIRSQVRKTNGTVAKTMTELEVMKRNYETCPARLYVKNPTMRDVKDWSIRKAAIIVGVTVTLLTIAVQVVMGNLK